MMLKFLSMQRACLPRKLFPTMHNAVVERESVVYGFRCITVTYWNELALQLQHNNCNVRQSMR